MKLEYFIVFISGVLTGASIFAVVSNEFDKEKERVDGGLISDDDDLELLQEEEDIAFTR